MKGTKKHIGMIVAGTVLVFFIAGCVSQGGGRIVAQSLTGERVTIQTLTDDFAKYNVYYAGTKPTVAVTVLFCPKDDDKTIKPDRWWNKIGDQASLSNIVSWMLTHIATSRPTVQFVMGPNHQVFGYVYSFNFQIMTRVVSDKEMIVYAPVNYYDFDFKNPPFWY